MVAEIIAETIHVNTQTQFKLYVNEAYLNQAREIENILRAENIVVSIEMIDVISNKIIKQATENNVLALFYDDEGLWLGANGMRMQPDWIAQVPRLVRSNHKNELVARACQLELSPQLFDATAGLGHDSLLMAWLGASVVLCERQPILYALLCDAKRQTQAYAQRMGYGRLQDVLARMTIHLGSAESYMQSLLIENIENKNSDTQKHAFDVIYLDPMFTQNKPETDEHGQTRKAKKVPQIKKEMQILHQLLIHETDNGANLLPLAKQLAKRVVVKRPRLAEYLNDDTPNHEWIGEACRFDGYFNLTSTIE